MELIDVISVNPPQTRDEVNGIDGDEKPGEINGSIDELFRTIRLLNGEERRASQV